MAKFFVDCDETRIRRQVGFFVSDVRKTIAAPSREISLRADVGLIPWFYGTFPRIIGRYVRDERLIPLEQAIHKMSGSTARVRFVPRHLGRTSLQTALA